MTKYSNLENPLDWQPFGQPVPTDPLPITRNDLPTVVEILSPPDTSPPATSNELVKRVFSEAFDQETRTLRDYAQERAVAAWRIVREHCTACGVLDRGELLRSADFLQLPTDMMGDPWYEALPPPAQAVAALSTSCCRGLFKTIQYYRYKAHSLPEAEWPSLLLFDRNGKEFVMPRAGIGCMPPHPPLNCLEIATSALRVVKDYNPRDDKGLEYFIGVTREIAGFLGIPRGAPRDQTLGKRSLAGLFNPFTARAAWPGPDGIVAAEELVCRSVLKDLEDRGSAYAFKQLQKQLGMFPREADNTIALAKEFLTKIEEPNIEHDRAVMLRNMRNLSDRARGAGDFQVEFRTMKEIAALQGLMKIFSDDDADLFAQQVEKAKQQRDRNKSLPYRSARALPGPVDKKAAWGEPAKVGTVPFPDAPFCDPPPLDTHQTQ